MPTHNAASNEVTRFSPTEQCLLNRLSDGREHSKEELLACLPEGETDGALRVQICRLRAKIKADILIVHRGGSYWMFTVQESFFSPEIRAYMRNGGH